MSSLPNQHTRRNLLFQYSHHIHDSGHTPACSDHLLCVCVCVCVCVVKVTANTHKIKMYAMYLQKELTTVLQRAHDIHRFHDIHTTLHIPCHNTCIQCHVLVHDL